MFKESTSIRIEPKHTGGSAIQHYLHSSQFEGLPDTRIYAVARDLVDTINKALESRPVIMGLPIAIRADGSQQPLTIVTSDQGLSIETLSAQVTDTPVLIEIHAPYPQILLAQARQLLDANQFGIAIVLAHTSCEVAAEQAMSDAFSKIGLQSLRDAVMSFLSGYNLANDRILALYTALTGDNIQLPNGFKTSSGRRNRIVHEGATATKQEAEDSYNACSALVTHILPRL